MEQDFSQERFCFGCDKRECFFRKVTTLQVIDLLYLNEVGVMRGTD